MRKKVGELQKVASAREGFVLPVVVFGLTLMSTMAVLAMMTADDEQRSSRAMHESSTALYAAEAGGNQVFAGWDTLAAGVDSLAPGDSLDLGWQTLGSGASYRAVIQRLHNGGQPMYALRVNGRGPGGALTGQKTLSFMLTSEPGGGGSGEVYKLGHCCDAPVVVKGSYEQDGRPGTPDDGKILHSGFDTHPPGWEAAGVCSDSLYHKPGIIMRDTSAAYLDLDPPEAVLEGVPAIVEDPTLSDSLWDYYGGHAWTDIMDRANIIVHEDGYVTMGDGSGSVKVEDVWNLPDINIDADEVYPRYNGDGSCDTNHPLNWGSDDPDDPCFDYFPIIEIRGEVELGADDDTGNLYAQGIFIMNHDPAAGTGSEFELEYDAEVRGVILGKGCVEVQYNAQFYGALYVDGSYTGATCDRDADLLTECKAYRDCVETRVQWSQCAVDRAFQHSDLSDLVEPEVGGGGEEGGALRFLGSRSFAELFQ